MCLKIEPKVMIKGATGNLIASLDIPNVLDTVQLP